MALKDLLVCIDPTRAGDARLKLAFNLARANKAHLSGAYVLADGNTAPRGPSGFGGVPGMTGFTEEPSPGGAVSEVFHEAEVADRVERSASRTNCGWPASRASGTSSPTATRPN